MKIVKASCIVIFITGLLAGVFFLILCFPPKIFRGTWHGKLSIPTGSLTIVSTSVKRNKALM